MGVELCVERMILRTAGPESRTCGILIIGPVGSGARPYRSAADPDPGPAAAPPGSSRVAMSHPSRSELRLYERARGTAGTCRRRRGPRWCGFWRRSCGTGTRSVGIGRRRRAMLQATRVELEAVRVRRRSSTRTCSVGWRRWRARARARPARRRPGTGLSERSGCGGTVRDQYPKAPLCRCKVMMQLGSNPPNRCWLKCL